MRIAINFIGTGNYLKFFPKYYETFTEYFAPNHTKDFFVLTDGSLGNNLPDDVKVISTQEDFEVTKSDYTDRYSLTYKSIGGLKRFGEIKKIKQYLKDYDWYVYFDADMYCCPEVITYEEFFDDTKSFFGVQHPCQNPNMCKFESPTRSQLPFERNEKSLACVKVEEQPDDIYLQGCVWGGKIPKIFELIEDLDNRIIEDLKNDIMTFAHDESYLNRYRIEHLNDFHVLSPSFAKPGDFPSDMFTFPARIIHSPLEKRQILLS